MSDQVKVDHEQFFALYREAYGPLPQSKVDGLESLLSALEADPDAEDMRWAAYMLATVKHECADTWQPIEEYGKGHGRPYGGKVKVTGSDGRQYFNVYYGRGYVQLTWKDNYEKMSNVLGLGDALLIDPAQALAPEIAYQILSYGMREGSFTGKKLSDYIHDDSCDYKNARRIINGLDQWERIKKYAEKLEAVLTQSQSS
jgi:hypothetical protein